MVLVVSVLLVSSGCSGDERQVADSPWAAEFQQVYDEATNDFVRAIVADGELTLAEMREAAARTNECFESVGSPATIDESSGGAFMLSLPHRVGYEGSWDTVVHYGSLEIQEASIACEFEYFNGLWGLWDATRVNPDGEDFNTLVAECLVRNEVAAAGLTGAMFQEAAMMCAFHFEHDPDNPLSPEEIIALSQAHWEANQDCRPQLPGPVYLDEGVAWNCQMDPLNN